LAFPSGVDVVWSAFAGTMGWFQCCPLVPAQRGGSLFGGLGVVLVKLDCSHHHPETWWVWGCVFQSPIVEKNMGGLLPPSPE